MSNKEVLRAMIPALQLNAVQLAKDLAEGSPYFIVEADITEINNRFVIRFKDVKSAYMVHFSPENFCWIYKKCNIFESIFFSVMDVLDDFLP